MTLQQCLNLLSENPIIILFFFCAVPLSATLAGALDRHEGFKSPWKYLYSGLIYMVTIPGLFALVLTIYLFFFENRSLLKIDLITQLLPIASMILTLWVIRKNVDLQLIPGFDRLSGLLIVILVLLVIFWVMEKMRIVAFTTFPFYYLILLFVGLVLVAVYGLQRFRSTE